MKAKATRPFVGDTGTGSECADLSDSNEDDAGHGWSMARPIDPTAIDHLGEFVFLPLPMSFDRYSVAGTRRYRTCLK